jgi:hypothetical protein
VHSGKVASRAHGAGKVPRMHNCPPTKANQQKSNPSAAEELDELVISADIDTSAHSKFHRPILVVEFWGGGHTNDFT